MKTSAQPSARILADLLVGHGIRNVVISPGSRSTPIVVAISHRKELKTTIVVDERTAGFVALGIAIQSGRPVALICTSGTALLNYAPAVAEAYYRCVSLIVVSADRPQQWIDQDDSQTIRQFEALENIVNLSVDISSDYEAKDFIWYTNRQINDAILAASAQRPGPVHINMRFDEPLGELIDKNAYEQKVENRLIKSVKPDLALSTSYIRKIVKENVAPPAKVLFVIGFLPPNHKLLKAFNKLADINNIAVLYEAQSNLQHIEGGCGRIDYALSQLDDEELKKLKPDLVISLGGSLVSRKIKKWLRSCSNIRHWHIGFGPRNRSVDAFKCLETRFEVDPVMFMTGFASAVQPYKHNNPSKYKREWEKLNNTKPLSENPKWSDLQVVTALVAGLDNKTNLHVSNGTSIRYLQLTDYRHIHRIECNRGVSGIDGSTATAIGASMIYPGSTVLLTGDMSARYDIGSLTLDNIPSRFSLVVLNNGGGDIFRVIGSTRNLDEREDFFACPSSLSFEKMALATGFDYERVTNLEELNEAVKHINAKRSLPLLVEVVTIGNENAEILRSFLGTTNQLKL